ncbi:MAG: protoheme IX farnesyltransferase [Candidatus Kapaibacteriota bacterium]
MKARIKDILTFVKIRIAVSVSISAVLGYILSTTSINFEFFWLWLAVLLIASGSGALNQVQEWQLDAKMQRTKNRPIPRKTFTPKFGLLFSSVLIILGLGILLLSSGLSLPFLLGIIAIFVYNAVYTPLKRISPFAAIPGALIGAIPPMIGWTYAGSEIFHPLNIAIALFFFVWQIPHFWLLLILYEDDYRNAGFPVLTELLSPLQISRISFVWIVILVVLSLLTITLLDRFNFLTLLAILSLGTYLIARTHRMVKVIQPQTFYRFAFINLNMFVLSVTLILSFQKILNL